LNDGIYRDLADIYDELMNDVPYSRWIEYVEKTFRRFDADPALVLDLACGTGTISLGLAERGYNVIGVDRAQKMIERAEAKRKVGENPQFFCQDLSSMDLPEIQADAAVCLFDSLNYITDYNDLCRAFKCTARHLNPGAIILAGGAPEKRFALPNSRMLIHQPSGKAFGTASEIETSALEIVRLKHQLNSIIAHHTGKSIEEVSIDTLKDYYLTPEAALQYHLIDKIIYPS
jgi:SAM-dependent methyltransferase